MCGTRDLHTEDGHQDDGLESSTHTITRLRNFHFLWIFIDRAFTAGVRHWYWFCRETRQKCLRQNSAAWCLRCTPSLMRSDSVQYHYYHVHVAGATTAVDESGKTSQLLSNAWCYFCFLCLLLFLALLAGRHSDSTPGNYCC